MRHDTDRYRLLLLAERAAVLAQARRCNPGLAESGAVDDEEWASFSHERFVSVQVEALHYGKLRLIDMALKRLELGDFGRCDDCDKPISPKRLDVIPWACRCVGCQEHVAELQDNGVQFVTAASGALGR